MQNFGPTSPHGTAFAPKQWLYEKEATGIDSSKMYYPSRCRYRTYCVEPQSTVWYGMLYKAKNGSMWNFGPTNPHRTAFGPKKWLYQKEATGMESLKMYYPSRCRYCTYQCGARKVPRFMGGSIVPRMEICGTSGLPISMVPSLHQSNGNMKRKLQAWRVEKCITLVYADTVLTSAGPQSIPFHWG